MVSQLVISELNCSAFRQALALKEEQLAISILKGQEEERERLCIELHDSVTQTIVSAYQLLQAREATPTTVGSRAHPLVTRAAALVGRAIEELREVINSNAPQALKELGLIDTLRQELKLLEEETACRVHFDAPRMRLPLEMEVALYRIAREAVTNVRRHAQSSRLLVAIVERHDEIAIRIKDWGRGFAPDLLEKGLTGQSAGLFGMRRRAELLGGVLEVKTSPGHGTEVTARVPLQRSKSTEAEFYSRANLKLSA